MRIIVTGGSGLIGQALIDDIVADNAHEIIVLSRSPEKKKPTLPGAVKVVKWDAKSGDGWVDYCEGDYAIVNLAAESLSGNTFPPKRWTRSRKDLILSSRLETAQAVIDAVKRAETKPRVVVQASAVGWYGSSSEEVTEVDPPGDDFGARVIVRTEAAMKPIEQMGVRLVTIRTGLVLTPEGGALPPLLLPFKLFAGGPLGSGKQYYSWIHIEDEVRAIRWLLTNDSANGVYNLTAPNPMTNAQVARTIGKVMKRPSFVPAPGFALKLALGEVSDVVLYGQPAIPKKLVDEGFEFTYTELEPALRNLLHGE